MALENLMVDSGPDLYYDENFLNVLEDHLPYLHNHPQTKIMVVDPDEAYQWRGDLYGMLQARGEPRQYHWLIMRLNGYTSPKQFTEDTVSLLKPSYPVVEMIAQSHNSASRIS